MGSIKNTRAFIKNEMTKHKIGGITKRWLINFISVIFLVLTVIVLCAFVFIKSYYYNSVSRVLIGDSDDAVDYLTDSAVPITDLRSAGISFIENSGKADFYEIQFINAEGKISVSSAGFDYSFREKPRDYLDAQATDDFAQWSGKNESGEKVLAVTRMLPADKGFGGEAVRIVVSLAPADRRIIITDLAVLAIAFFMLFFVVISGTYFINSIVNPVRQIGTMAGKIARGDFAVRLEKKYDDEIGELCDSINYMANELASAEKVKNEFISSVSHELRTPLTAIKGWGETLIQCTPEDTEMYRRGMRIIIRESERLSGLVEELLDFSRMQTGKLKMRLERIDILAELGEVVYMFEERAKTEKKSLIFSEPDFLSPVMGDANRLKQVFLNLIDNAIKYTEEEGTIVVSASEEDGFITITVSDTGCGIPESELSKVKERFYKANNQKHGFGIGLAVADEIVAMHNGELDIKSSEGIGTTVTVRLPVIPQSDNRSDIALDQPEKEKNPNEADNA